MAEVSRCGLVALVGAPNVGKSTLMNALVGHKVGIVSPKANTTRVVVRGVRQEGTAQLVFVDTPGLNTSTKAFDRQLVQQARGSLADADVVALVIDATRGFDAQAKALAESFAAKPDMQVYVLVINKMDKLTPRSKVLELMTAAQAYGCFTEVFAVSATKGGGVDDIAPALAKLLPEGPWLFAPDQATDMPLPLRLAEVTREKVMLNLHEEVPYAVGVVTTLLADDEAPVLVQQTLLLARDAHKPLVLGKGGGMLKRIGSAAREEMQTLLGKGVRLELQVEVKPRWLEQQNLLAEMGVLNMDTGDGDA
ncbi:MAG: GTPase Era [Pseudomonadaceae bacterium]|nr:GTPase Era [Pseudomonadaceae bacterium]